MIDETLLRLEITKILDECYHNFSKEKTPFLLPDNFLQARSRLIEMVNKLVKQGEQS